MAVPFDHLRHQWEYLRIHVWRHGLGPDQLLDDIVHGTRPDLLRRWRLHQLPGQRECAPELLLDHFSFQVCLREDDLSHAQRRQLL